MATQIDDNSPPVIIFTYILHHITLTKVRFKLLKVVCINTFWNGIVNKPVIFQPFV